MSASSTISALASKDWQLADEDAAKPAALVIQLRRGAHVFPWHRFVHAEGDNARVQIMFSTHMVHVTGHGLAALLVALASMRVVRLIEPADSEAKFGVRGGTATYDGPSITDITVNKFE